MGFILGGQQSKDDKLVATNVMPLSAGESDHRKLVGEISERGAQCD